MFFKHKRKSKQRKKGPSKPFLIFTNTRKLRANAKESSKTRDGWTITTRSANINAMLLLICRERSPNKSSKLLITS